MHVHLMFIHLKDQVVKCLSTLLKIGFMYTKRAYLSGILNLNLIGHDRPEIHSKDINEEFKKNNVY